MKALSILIAAGFSLPAASIGIKEACPILRQAVYHQEANVSTYELQFPNSPGPAIARAEWEPKKALALEKIAYLEALADSILQSPE